MKRKIYTTLAALSLVFAALTTQGCFYGPGGGWGGGYGGGYGAPVYSSAAPYYGPAFVGHPWVHDGFEHDGFGHGYVGRGYAAGHGFAPAHSIDGGHAVAHEAHRESNHRG